MSRLAFIAWVVGSSRNRDNWELTNLNQVRNTLRLITALAMWSRDVSSVDPIGNRRVFEGTAFKGDVTDLPKVAIL